MFTLGALAQALNRPPVTIRLWIRKGYLPAAPYRLPAAVNKHGVAQQNRRLYSRAMIEKAIELFTLAGVLDDSRIEWSNHQQLSNQLAEAWTSIRAEETK